MATLRDKDFKSWKELSDFLNNTFTHFNNFIFRGHANSNWLLESTIARSIKKFYPSEKDPSLLIRAHLDSFKINIRGKSSINFKDVSDNEIWALGQHFGLYTPLLDFTRSPYVALFFALQGQSESGKRCIWALEEHQIDLLNVAKERKDKLEMVVPLTNDNQRLVSQQGLFLKIPSDCSIEDLISKYNYSRAGTAFYKLTFDDIFREDALLILQNMNINELTLFPDLIGSARHSNYLFEIQPYLLAGQDKVWKDYNAKTK